MNTAKYSIIIAWSEEDQCFSAICPELDINADGETRTVALINLEQAIREWIISAGQLNWEIPEPITIPFSCALIEVSVKKC